MSLRSMLSKVDISPLLTKAWFDQIIGDPSPRTIVEILDLLHYGDGVFSDPTMSGAEDELGGAFGAPGMSWAEGYLDLSNMEAGDTIIIREYVGIWPDGVPPHLPSEPQYKLYASHTYSGVQAEPLIHFTQKQQMRGWYVSAEQTAGTFRVVPFLFWFTFLT